MHKTRFFNTNLDYLTSEWPKTQNVKSVAHFDMFQNGLWARQVASKLTKNGQSLKILYIGYYHVEPHVLTTLKM